MAPATDPHRLPAIPALPPIQLPPSSAQFVPIQHGPVDDTLLTSASCASEDSFATAFTSSSTNLAALSPPSTDVSSGAQYLATPRPLRKSFSVDSFIQQRIDHPPSSSTDHTRAMRARRDSIVDPDMSAWRAQPLPGSSKPSGSQSILDRIRAGKGRARGSSLSVAQDDHTDAFFEDSDIERSNDMVRRREGRRRRLSKAKGPVLAVPQPGELALPSRLATSISAASSTTSSATAMPTPLVPAPDRLRQSASSSSVASLQARDVTPTYDPSLGRRRSGSAGLQLAAPPGPKIHGGKRIRINTENLGLSDSSEFVIVVVGSEGCGKSSFIRKSLKHYGLTEPEPRVATIGSEGSLNHIPYVFRTARIPDSGPTIEKTINVLEVSCRALRVGESQDPVVSWPPEFRHVDGAFVCYDAINPVSFEPVREILGVYDGLKVPTIVLACKSDAEKRVSPEEALKHVQHFAGIVEVTNRTEGGKAKMRKCLDHLFKAIVKDKAISRATTGNYIWRNPASPGVLNVPVVPWDSTAAAAVTLTASSSMSSVLPPAEHSARVSQVVTVMPPSSPTTRSPSAPTSPTRARSTSDLLSEHQKSVVVAKREREGKPRNISSLTMPVSRSAESLCAADAASPLVAPPDEPVDEPREAKGKEPPPSPWATLEDLLDKLFFLSVSGDDPAFISHFFLTYRRFATPRSVLLGMQKRMIELSQPSDDFMLASFAQMRICNLLENWMKEYPSDFAVPGTAGALSAFTKHVLSHTHTLHYGSDFLPFLEMLPNLVDQDSTWALPVEDVSVESDESDSMFGDDHESDTTEVESPCVSSPSKNGSHGPVMPDAGASSSRERKSSLPLVAKTILQAPLGSASAARAQNRVQHHHRLSTKDLLARLVKQAHAVMQLEANDIANEITRIEADLFLKIEPRHWLRHTLVPGKKDPEHDPIAKFHAFYNYVHDWAVSLILCHDKPKVRARQIEKLACVAAGLRSLNNYSGLRAIVTAISNSSFPGDLPMELFKTKTDLYKKFRSSDILLHSTGSYRSYRLALRNTKGPCIPALEVHMSDLLRAHEGNPDFKSDDTTKIHWGKFNMIGKFISSTSQFQAQCREPNEYNFTENKYIHDLLRIETLDYDTQQSRINAPAEYDGVDPYSAPIPTLMSHDISNHPKDIGGLRRLFFW